jgi:3-deoxy-D-arabino-heptulosonate 7-phosphate (DAHP) synthase
MAPPKSCGQRKAACEQAASALSERMEDWRDAHMALRYYTQAPRTWLGAPQWLM